ncbi:MAG: hydrogenase formation protein HypD [Cyclobacteriaceae bacterium]|nr:hydrogenase formation protein HypD [Cyclobacteriaceae bacterium]
MKHLEEYRDKRQVRYLIDKIRDKISTSWNIMEICGGQTHSLLKNGLIEILPEGIIMIHGPGCPVCVTPAMMIDKAIALALNTEVILCSFGDMLRVPGNEKSLLKAKAEGADVRMVYSPLDALAIARKNPEKHIVFFAVGFETTAPANALSVIQAKKLDLDNFSILSSHVLVPPAMAAILRDEETHVQGFLAAGHVCSVMGTDEYEPVAREFNVPIVVTGFEPVDMLNGIYQCISMLENGKTGLMNQYSRVVRSEGNIQAKKIISEVFEVGTREWRGIGEIPQSGLVIRKEYDRFNAEKRFTINKIPMNEDNACMAGLILKGIKKPHQCPYFRNRCTPENPMGAPMVSSEGACAAYYHYGYESAT